MLGLISQPKVQSADSAVVTLCDRLDNSPLFEDRKAAVLALRGLAHENRELVASIGLKGLLHVLVKDSFDPAAAKVTLETLLILFNTDTRRRTRYKRFSSPLRPSPEQDSQGSAQAQIANDISLWLTDQLLHNSRALATVLDLAATKNDPFTAVYALQLVSVMTVHRPLETKRILLEAGGVASLVAALGSAQDMVRDEALLLVSALTYDHLEMQKLVAFENGFDLALQILLDNGGVVFGGRFAEDSLALISNLIEYNTSNQKLFVNTNLDQYAQIVQGIVDVLNDEQTSPHLFQKEQVVANIDSALQISRLLCLPDGEQTPKNQNLLHKSGVLTATLQTAFSSLSQPAMRVSALMATAAMIHSNEERQKSFLDTDVPYCDLATAQVPNVIPVSNALINWCILLNSRHLFELRCASMVCLRSAMNNSNTMKAAFINEQISTYKSRTFSPNANLIETLAEYSDEVRLNPFRTWFAASILMQLLDGEPDLKERLRHVEIGDASIGMDVQPLVQALAGELQGSLHASNSSQAIQEPTVVLAYLQLLSVWLFDDVLSVNDFLAETSTVHTLLPQHMSANSLISSLSVVLLGVAYAFCSKTSPLPRKQFYELLSTSLGQDQYKLSIRRFKESPEFVNFEEQDMFNAPKADTGFPAVYLNATFVELMREALPHISHVIDMDPEVEPATKITFEMVDTANEALLKKTKELEEVRTELVEAKKAQEKLAVELKETVMTANEHSDVVTSHKEKLEQTEKELETVKTSLKKTEDELAATTEKLEQREKSWSELQTKHNQVSQEFSIVKAAKEKGDNGINNMTRELFQLQREKESLEKENKKLDGELSKLKPKLESTSRSENALKIQVSELQTKFAAEQQSAAKLKETNDKLTAKLRETANILKDHEQEEEKLSAELAELRISSESEGNELRTLKNREGAARKKLEAKESELEAARKTLQENFAREEKLAKRLMKLEEVVAALKHDKVKVDKKVSETQKSHDELKETNEKMMKEITELKSNDQVAKLESDLKEKQNDLEELMVLLEDLSEKKSAYKNRVRSAGEDVSDSDEDDE